MWKCAGRGRRACFSMAFFPRLYARYHRFYSCRCAVHPRVFSKHSHPILPKSSFWIVCCDPKAFSGPWKWIIFAAWLSSSCIVAVQLCIVPPGNQWLISWKLLGVLWVSGYDHSSDEFVKYINLILQNTEKTITKWWHKLLQLWMFKSLQPRCN